MALYERYQGGIPEIDPREYYGKGSLGPKIHVVEDPLTGEQLGYRTEINMGYDAGRVNPKILIEAERYMRRYFGDEEAERIGPLAELSNVGDYLVVTSSELGVVQALRIAMGFFGRPTKPIES